MFKLVNFYYFLSLFIILLKLILVVLVARGSYNLWKTNSDDDFFWDLENTLREPFLIGLYTSNSSCGNNTLISQYWENKNGCYCMKTKKLNEGICSSDDIANFCVNIIGNKNFYEKWKGMFICKKQAKYSYNNYFDFVKSIDDCPSSHPKKCGILDDIGYSLCLKEDEVCPINDIKVVTDYTKEKYTNYEAISLGTRTSEKGRNINSTLIYSNMNTKGKIVSQFKVSEEKPCYGRNKINSPSIQDFYKLAVITQNRCDEIDQDNNFIILDTYDHKSFFSENVIPDLRDDLSVDFANNKPIHLYYRNYIGMKSTFTSNFDEDRFKTKMVSNIFDCLEKMYVSKHKIPSTHLSTLLFSFFLVFASLYMVFLGVEIYLLLSLPSNIDLKPYLQFGHFTSFCSITLSICSFIIAEVFLLIGLDFKSGIGNAYQIFRNEFSVDYSWVMNVKLDNMDILKIEPLAIVLCSILNILFAGLINLLLNLLCKKINPGDKTLTDPLKCISNCTSQCNKSLVNNHIRLPETQLTTSRQDNTLNI